MELATLQKISAQILAQKLPTYHRYLFGQIDFKSKLIGITGQRGCGKTTILLQYTKTLEIEPSNILYISCDHPAMAGISLYYVAESFYARGGKVLIVDEIHKAEDFSSQLKAIYDVFDMQVLFSGSSAIKLEHSKADLSRRAVMHKLGVMSLREFVEIEFGQVFPAYSLNEILTNHENIAVDIMSKIRPLEQFIKYQSYGCYPFYQESLTDYPKKLAEIVSLGIDLDLCGIFSIDPSKLDKLKKILYMLCASPPYELNISKLSGAIGVSWPTISKYLDYMNAGNLIHIVRVGSKMRAVNKPDKLLLNNPNLFGVLCANPSIGTLLESFFVSQMSNSHQIHYHDKGDFIVDDSLVFEIGGKNKSFEQLDEANTSYLAMDDLEIGYKNKIPLWLFGFMY
jgi:hypothetical protein